MVHKRRLEVVRQAIAHYNNDTDLCVGVPDSRVLERLAELPVCTSPAAMRSAIQSLSQELDRERIDVEQTLETEDPSFAPIDEPPSSRSTHSPRAQRSEREPIGPGALRRECRFCGKHYKYQRSLSKH